MRAQSPAESGANSHPAILGTLDKGKYSNHVIGFEIQLDPVCAISNEPASIDFVHKFPQRLILSIHCGDYTLTLVSWPLYPDEPADLITQSEPSLLGAIDGLKDDGLKFKRRGAWQKKTANGTEILVQELVGRSDSGEAIFGFYNGFLVGRRYISILVIGPKKNEPQLSQIGTAVRLDGNPAN
ncbi:MAG TPA: hypothetical protein VFU86_08485 [Terriglobales bacterium]|nr:hypothetical protein [Terriglobales bacterium]